MIKASPPYLPGQFLAHTEPQSLPVQQWPGGRRPRANIHLTPHIGPSRACPELRCSLFLRLKVPGGMAGEESSLVIRPPLLFFQKSKDRKWVRPPKQEEVKRR